MIGMMISEGIGGYTQSIIVTLIEGIIIDVETDDNGVLRAECPQCGKGG